jgi:hypothetical protein
MTELQEPRGQTLIPERAMRVRAYMTRDRNGGLDLVMPDGIEVFLPTKH